MDDAAQVPSAPRPAVRRLAIAAGAALYTVLFLLVVAFGVEWYLTARKNEETATSPVFSRLWKAYRPFAIQHPHPFYFFFFPLEPEARLAIGNDVCSIDERGFRGPGPEAAAGRKLGFLVGGSAAFGAYASSDATTITGYLNAQQSSVHFVNAGVPSWNSTQELTRVAQQLLRYRPQLVIAYDGANDAAILDRYLRYHLNFPPGTPENFEEFQALIEDMHGRRRRVSLGERLFPRITRGLRKRALRRIPVDPAVREARTRDGVAAYARNLELMRTLVAADGGRFVGIFQPIRSLHAGVPDSHRRERRLPTYRRFHELAVGPERPAVEYYDFATLFDGLYAQVPSIRVADGEDVDDQTVFVDDVHLFDVGNELVARSIIERLGL
jgi:hypothetical protein